MYAAILNQVWWSIPKGIAQPLLIASSTNVILITLIIHSSSRPPAIHFIFLHTVPVFAATNAIQKLYTP